MPSPENSATGAKSYEALLRQQLLKGENILATSADVPLFKDFTEKWFANYVKSYNKPSEYSNKQSVFKVHLLPFFGKFRLDQISTLMVEEFKAKKIKTALSYKSINKILSMLRIALKTAEEWEMLKLVPKIKFLKVPPQKFDFLLPDEADNLLVKTDGIWHDMILLAIKAGLRFGEIIALSWKDVDFLNKQLTVEHSIVRGIPGSTKSNKIRYVPMTGSLVAMLEQRDKKDDYIFTLGDNKPMKQIYCIKNLQRICKKIGLRHIGWHMLRHTFASHLAIAGISPIIIKELLGHADITTTMRYSHLSPAAIRESVEVLDRQKAVPINFRHNYVTIEKNETDSALVNSPKLPENKTKTALSDCFC